jgi:hypothetical protein
MRALFVGHDGVCVCVCVCAYRRYEYVRCVVDVFSPTGTIPAMDSMRWDARDFSLQIM